MRGKKRQELDGEGRASTIDSPIRRRRAKIAAAVLIFALTTVSTLIIQDLYSKAKDTVDSSPFSTFVSPYDECPQSQWLFPEGFDLQTLPGFDQLDSQWAYEHGGYSAEESVTDLTFQANKEKVVVLRGMRIEVTERKAPTKGTVISKCPIRMKPALDVRRFETDLDDPEPSIVPQASTTEMSTGAKDGSDVFRGFPYKISQSDPEVFQLTARTTNCSCSWRAELDWTVSGESGTTPITIGSTPFRTAASDGAEKLYYRPDGTLHR